VFYRTNTTFHRNLPRGRVSRIRQVLDCSVLGPKIDYLDGFLGAFAKSRQATVVSLGMSAWNGSAANGRISMKFDI
jgi:hypothetical protein